MPVPKEGQLLFQGPVGAHHSLAPPLRKPLRFVTVGDKDVKRLSNRGLHVQRPGVRGQQLDSVHVAILVQALKGSCKIVFGGRIAFVEDVRLVEFGEKAVVQFFVIDEIVDGLLRRHVGEALDFFRRAAESGALEEMARTLIAPIGLGNRRQAANPFNRRRGRRCCTIAQRLGCKMLRCLTARGVRGFLPRLRLLVRGEVGQNLRLLHVNPSIAILVEEGESWLYILRGFIQSDLSVPVCVQKRHNLLSRGSGGHLG